jgi:hypothetical protein
MFPSGRRKPQDWFMSMNALGGIWAHWGTLKALPLRHTKHIAYAYAIQARIVPFTVEGKCDTVHCKSMRKIVKKAQRLKPISQSLIEGSHAATLCESRGKWQR